MLVKLTLAVTITFFGSKVEHYGAKKCLVTGMSLLTILTIFVAILLLNAVTSKIMYIILFGLGVGLLSATGWPSCLYVSLFLSQLLSQYFDKKNSTSLPIWNGSTQFGDFLALFISDIVI